MTARMSVGEYTIHEERRSDDGDYLRVVLDIYADGSDSPRAWVTVILMPPSIMLGAQNASDPDLAECLGLALDRAAEILREAKG